jgi:hypothetical protein
MKNIKSITLNLVVLVSICVTIISCKKGDVGPAGANGVANIQAGTITTNNSAWSFDNTDNSYNAILNYSAITQSVVENGTVQVFIGDGLGTEWAALPFSYSDLQYNYSYKLGQVLVSLTLSTGSVPSNPGGQQFKVVVIPPAAKSINPSNIDSKKSEAVFVIK